MAFLSVGTRMTYSRLLKTALFVGSSGLVLGVFLFTHQLVARLSQEIETTSRILARFCAQASLPATTDPALREIFSEVIGNLDFPMVITDEDGTPRAWRELDLEPELVPASSIDSLKAGLVIAPVIQERIRTVQQRVIELDRQNPPIEMVPPGSVVSVGAVHYGVPPVLGRLRWMPIVSIVGMAVLLLIGFWGLAIIRQAEQRTIWVGMAKETAHQLGTPLSSLMGWIELLRGAAEGEPAGREGRVEAARMTDTIAEMERDIERLNKVVQRFSHVGSMPRLQTRDVAPIVRDVVQYMRRRTPQGSGDVVIRERYEPTPEVKLNPELIEWAVENLIANALSALDKRPGVIDVSVASDAVRRGVEVTITDNGRGMTRAEQRRAFEPGYTTRRRGWGLGLPLARRVVQEYHGGRLSIRSSAPGQGTSMVISLPA